MLKFLADENISPATIEMLRSNDYDVIGVRDVGLKGYPDESIFAYAIKENRIIITLDSDFGEIYYFSSQAPAGVILLRLKSRWFEAVNDALLRLLGSGKMETEEFKNALIIVMDDRYRIRKK